ncbi:MAG: caspase family protein, partial [Acidobacteriota bacterium]
MSKSYQAKYENSWALIVGINAYRNFAPLTYACNDADAVESVLANELGFQKSNMIVLRDDHATKEEILNAYLGLSERADNPDDRVVFFFAGHGLTRTGLRGPIGYLVPVDGKSDNLNSLIRWDDLTRNAELIPAKHILFIIDACYSGLAFQRVIPPGTKRFVSENLQRLARQVITAGKADETVADGGGPQGMNSIFTGYLIEGLRGSASDSNGVITANALMNYVYERVGKDERSRQTPHYGHIEGDGDFIIRVPDGIDFITETKPEQPEASKPIPSLGVKAGFVERAGYTDPTHPNFGRNEWSNKLGEERWGRESNTKVSKAFSWLSIIFEPAADEIASINIANQLDFLKNLKPSGENPYEGFTLPTKVMTTLNSV